MGKYLKLVRPNAGVGARYDKSLTKYVDDMHASILRWLIAAIKANPPHLAKDESPLETIRRALAMLRKRWTKRINDFAPKFAEAFVTGAARHADAAFMASLRDAGFTVRFRSSRKINEALNAKIVENVSLIKSIPAEHFADIEQFVMRAVQKGRDIAALTRDLEDRYQVTRRRAALIARDQNNKATAVIQRIRRLELGIKEAEWLHSGGGKHPRPAHVAFSGKKFDVDKGAFIDGKYIQPGEEINCRCTSRIRIDSLQLPKS